MRAGLNALSRNVQPMLRRLLRLLYPPHCAVCQRSLEQGLLCSPCEESLCSLTVFHCLTCGVTVTGNDLFCTSCRKESAIEHGVGYGLYEEGNPLAVLIQSLKYRGDRALIKALGPRLLQIADRLSKPEAITFVPLRRKRQRQRGFNQSQLLAQFLGTALQLPVCALLKKTRDTLPQASLKRQQRLRNLDDAFVAKANSHKVVWLVDDICTTGTTLKHCARALKATGIKRVETLVLAVASLN